MTGGRVRPFLPGFLNLTWTIWPITAKAMEGHTDRGAIAGDSRLAAIHHRSEPPSEPVGHTDRSVYVVVSRDLQC
jgi:hypothetical protein